jgi:hypothetical protein
MDNAIKDMTSWDEASRWLAKHGYGIDQINQQKALWHASVVADEAVTVKVKTAVDPVKKVEVDKTPSKPVKSAVSE